LSEAITRLRLRRFGVNDQDEADAPRALALLRLPCKRLRHRASEK
jgi:hypothetical protein